MEEERHFLRPSRGHSNYSYSCHDRAFFEFTGSVFHLSGKFYIEKIKINCYTCSIYYKIVPYKTFSSTNPTLDFTFEYPSELSEKIQEYKDWPDKPEGYIEITLESSSETTWVSVQDATADYDPLNLQQGVAYQAKNWGNNFEILKQDTITLNGVSGYDLEFKYDDSRQSVSKGNNNIQAYDRDIFVERNNRIYSLRLSVWASQTDSIKGFQHLLDTWKWK